MALKALKRTGTFRKKKTSINSNRECCVVLASIQTRTIGIVIFGQRLLVLPALNPLCFTAFTITVSLMPSFKQPLSWDLGFGIFGGFGQCLLPCLHSSYFIPLHSPSKFLSNNEKKKLFSFSFIQATLCNFFPLLRTCALLTVGICFRKKCFLHLFLYPVDLSAI